MRDTQEPVAWHVIGDDYEYSTLLEEHARAIVEEEGGTVAPLYRSPTITGAERTAIEGVIEDYEHDGEPASAGRVATLRGLLARLK